MRRLGSLATFARKLAMYKLDLVGVQEVRSDRGHSKIRELYSFYGKQTKNIK
jgi:hypothetical protein